MYLKNSAIVTNCTIQGNKSAYAGGGVYMTEWPSLLNCRIINNCSTRINSGGAGIFISGGIVKNCVIMNNYTTHATGGRGGGIYASRGGGASDTNQILISNCLIASNSAVSSFGGGGFLIYDEKSATLTNVSFRNCTIVNNNANAGGGVRLHSVSTNFGMFNLVIVSNTAATDPNLFDRRDIDMQYNMLNSCSTPLMPKGSGNTTNDPIFADPANDNWRLTRDSPCVNKGLNQEWMTGAVDLDGHSRKDQFSGMVDMGCYEFLPSGAMFSFH